MKPGRLSDWLKIDELSATPKYRQLTNAILKAVETGLLRTNDLMPSINELSAELEISRDTAEKGYRYLKSKGFLGSVPGKGYFIQQAEIGETRKIFLLFNKLSAHKKIIYDAFVNTLGDRAVIDFYIYNNDFALFKKLLVNQKDDYTHYVIIPHFLEGAEFAPEIINRIPKEKLILLDKKMPGITGGFAAVYENFEKDIYEALTTAGPRLTKYRNIKIIFPENTYYPVEIIHGCRRFCQEHGFPCSLVGNISDEIIQEGDVYISVMEEDLVILIERILQIPFTIGEQVGVISYNETPLKKIILNGITTVSTDFHRMGEMAARLVLDHSESQLEVPFYLTLRNSL